MDFLSACADAKRKRSESDRGPELKTERTKETDENEDDGKEREKEQSSPSKRGLTDEAAAQAAALNKSQALSFWRLLEEKEKGEGSGFLVVRQRSPSVGQGKTTRGKGSPLQEGQAHRSISFDSKQTLMDQLAACSSPSASSSQGSPSLSPASGRREDGRPSIPSPPFYGTRRTGSGRRLSYRRRGGSGGASAHVRNHSFSTPFSFHHNIDYRQEEEEDADHHTDEGEADEDPLNSIPPSTSTTSLQRHFSSSPSLLPSLSLSLPFRSGRPYAHEHLLRSDGGEEEWERPAQAETQPTYPLLPSHEGGPSTVERGSAGVERTEEERGLTPEVDPKAKESTVRNSPSFVALQRALATEESPRTWSSASSLPECRTDSCLPSAPKQEDHEQGLKKIDSDSRIIKSEEHETKQDVKEEEGRLERESEEEDRKEEEEEERLKQDDEDRKRKEEEGRKLKGEEEQTTSLAAIDNVLKQDSSHQEEAKEQENLNEPTSEQEPVLITEEHTDSLNGDVLEVNHDETARKEEASTAGSDSISSNRNHEECAHKEETDERAHMREVAVQKEKQPKDDTERLERMIRDALSVERSEWAREREEWAARLQHTERAYEARLADQTTKLHQAEENIQSERQKRREVEKQNKKLLERLRETELLLKIAQQKEKKIRLEQKRRGNDEEKKSKATKQECSAESPRASVDDEESRASSARPSSPTAPGSGGVTGRIGALRQGRYDRQPSQSDREEESVDETGTESESETTETEEEDTTSLSSEESSESSDSDESTISETSESETTGSEEARQMERRKTKVTPIVLVDMPLRRSNEKKKSGSRKANSEGEEEQDEEDKVKRVQTAREHRKKPFDMGTDDRSKRALRVHEENAPEVSRSAKDKKAERQQQKEIEDDDQSKVNDKKSGKPKKTRRSLQNTSLLRVFKSKTLKKDRNDTAPSGLIKQIAKERKKERKKAVDDRDKKKSKKARKERKKTIDDHSSHELAVAEDDQLNRTNPDPVDGGEWRWRIDDSESNESNDNSDGTRGPKRRCKRDKNAKHSDEAPEQEKEAESDSGVEIAESAQPSEQNIRTEKSCSLPTLPTTSQSSCGPQSSSSLSAIPAPPQPPPMSTTSVKKKNATTPAPAQEVDDSEELRTASRPQEQEATGGKSEDRGRAYRRTIAVPKEREKRKKDKARAKEDGDTSAPEQIPRAHAESDRKSTFSDDHTNSNWRSSLQFTMQFGSFTERPPKEQLTSRRTKALFGVPLENLGDSLSAIPTFLEQAFLYLEEKALRVTGLFEWDVDSSTVQLLRSAIEGSGEVEFDAYGTHAVGELVKHFIECLPDPLIPKHLCNSFMASADIQYRNFKLNVVHYYLSQLSPNARELISRLCNFLTLYNKHSSYNKTTIGKLSAVFGPLVLRPTEEEGSRYSSFIQSNSTRTKRKSASAFQVLVAENETLFLHMPHVAKYHVKNGRVCLQAATLGQIVEQMVDENFKDAGLADIVFLTHGYFTTSVGLLKEILSIFEKHRKAEGKSWQYRLRIRILQLLKDWIVLYGTDLVEDADFVHALNNFTKPGTDSKCSNNVEEDSLYSQIRTLLFSYEQKRKAPARLIRNLSSLNGFVNPPSLQPPPMSPHGTPVTEDFGRTKSLEVPSPMWLSSPTILSRTSSSSPRTSQPSSPYQSSSSISTRPQSDNEEEEPSTLQYDTQTEDDSDSDSEEQTPRELTRDKSRSGDDEFLDLDPEETAKQLTLIDNQLFRAIPKKELLCKRFMSPDSSPHFTAMANRFNMTASWVGSVVFAYEQPARRAKAIAHLIDICQACLRQNNFNSVFALMAGLNNTAVSRLKQSWERVPRKQMRRFKEMMAMLADAKNHSAYRQELARARPPLVPYAALFSKDLFGVEESNVTVTSDGLINFAKMCMIAKLVNEFAAYQVTYPIAIDANLRALLKGFQQLSENEQYDRSYRLEPRKNG